MARSDSQSGSGEGMRSFQAPPKGSDPASQPAGEAAWFPDKRHEPVATRRLVGKEGVHSPKSSKVSFIRKCAVEQARAFSRKSGGNPWFVRSVRSSYSERLLS